MNDTNKQHQQQLYNEKLTNKKNEVEKHVKETISSRKKNKNKNQRKITLIQMLYQELRI